MESINFQPAKLLNCNNAELLGIVYLASNIQPLIEKLKEYCEVEGKSFQQHLDELRRIVESGECSLSDIIKKMENNTMDDYLPVVSHRMMKRTRGDTRTPIGDVMSRCASSISVRGGGAMYGASNEESDQDTVLPAQILMSLASSCNDGPSTPAPSSRPLSWCSNKSSRKRSMSDIKADERDSTDVTASTTLSFELTLASMSEEEQQRSNVREDERSDTTLSDADELQTDEINIGASENAESNDDAKKVMLIVQKDVDSNKKINNTEKIGSWMKYIDVSHYGVRTLSDEKLKKYLEDSCPTFQNDITIGMCCVLIDYNVPNKCDGLAKEEVAYRHWMIKNTNDTKKMYMALGHYRNSCNHYAHGGGKNPCRSVVYVTNFTDNNEDIKAMMREHFRAGQEYVWPKGKKSSKNKPKSPYFMITQCKKLKSIAEAHEHMFPSMKPVDVHNFNVKMANIQF